MPSPGPGAGVAVRNTLHVYTAAGKCQWCEGNRASLNFSIPIFLFLLSFASLQKRQRNCSDQTGRDSGEEIWCDLITFVKWNITYTTRRSDERFIYRLAKMWQDTESPRCQDANIATRRHWTCCQKNSSNSSFEQPEVDVKPEAWGWTHVHLLYGPITSYLSF